MHRVKGNFVSFYNHMKIYDFCSVFYDLVFLFAYKVILQIEFYEMIDYNPFDLYIYFILGQLLRKFDQLHIIKSDGLFSYQSLLLIPCANKFELLTPPKPPPPGIIKINSTTLFSLDILSNIIIN